MPTADSKPWHVYIIQAESGALYTGISCDVARRLEEHRTMKKGARFFHLSSPKSLLFCEPHPNRSQASKRESAIKKLSRLEKLELIDSVKR